MDILFAILLYFGLIPSPDATGAPPTTAALTADGTTDPSDGGSDAKPRVCGNRCSY
ncbi:hypothetical protein [Lysobacter sp. TY2-98]|uniref:hypothetical protein n=1 Tax=Lysobacter sp. TY2-98 TaxID=2290922 RepID=UPI0013B44E3F|nr:hypothetical protein [Lysobacter sp. TY2-98]